jgi:hypothetical protein
MPSHQERVRRNYCAGRIDNLKDLMEWCRQFEKPTIIFMPINLWEIFSLELQRNMLIIPQKLEILQFRDNVRIVPIK